MGVAAIRTKITFSQHRQQQFQLNFADKYPDNLNEDYIVWNYQEENKINHRQDYNARLAQVIFIKF